MEEGTPGPVHELDPGRYHAVIRAGVPMIERSDTAGAVLAIEWPSDEYRQAWEEAIRSNEWRSRVGRIV